jgi:hypothetical protein
MIFGQHAVVVSSLLLPPDPYSRYPVHLLAGVLAVPASVLYLRRGGSVGDLGSFFFTLMAAVIGTAFALFLVGALAGFDAGLGNGPGLALLLAGDAVAYLRVYRDAS